MYVSALQYITMHSMHYIYLFLYIFWRARVCWHPFAYVAHFVFLRDVWIRIQRAAAASRCATNLATHLPKT